MRDLTAEELALAPEWAYYYDFFNDKVVYMAKDKNRDGDYKFFSKDFGVYFGNESDFNLCARLVQRKNKTFDITQHEWSDDNLSLRCIDFEGDINMWCKDVDDELFINKNDAIAIAKHFKLTAEDLK